MNKQTYVIDGYSDDGCFFKLDGDTKVSVEEHDKQIRADERVRVIDELLAEIKPFFLWNTSVDENVITEFCLEQVAEQIKGNIPDPNVGEIKEQKEFDNDR